MAAEKPQERRALSIVPKCDTFPWVVARLTGPALGIQCIVKDGHQTQKEAEENATRKTTQEGGVHAVLQYRFIFAPEVVGKAPVAAKGLKAPVIPPSETDGDGDEEEDY